MKRMLLAVTLLAANTTPAAVLDWAAPLTQPPYDEVKDVAMSNGYVFVTGSSYTNRTQADYMTAKYGPEGEIVWLRRAGTEAAGIPQMDEPVDVHADAAGCGYVTGRAENDTMITVKYSEAGNEEWRVQANGRAVAVAADGAGNVYVGGDRTSIGHPNRDVIIAKYNSRGALRWEATVDGIGFGGGLVAIAVDAAGNVTASGFYLSDATPASTGMLTFKLDSSGHQLWKALGPAGAGGMPTALTIDASGNTYVTGHDYLGSGVFLVTTLKYNSTGTEQWVRRLSEVPAGNYFGRDISVDASGATYVTGRGDEYGGVYSEVTAKYDMAGTLQWVVRRVGVPSARMAGDAAGNTYHLAATDALQLAVYAYDSNGTETASTTYQPAPEYTSVAPIGIATAGGRVASIATLDGPSGADFLTLLHVFP